MNNKEKRELLKYILTELQKSILVDVKLCREDVILPEYAHDGDAGINIRPSVSVLVRSGETVIVPTGLKIAIPEGYELQVEDQ